MKNRLTTDYSALNALAPLDKSAAVVTNQRNVSDNFLGEKEQGVSKDTGLIRQLMDEDDALQVKLEELDRTPRERKTLKEKRRKLRKRVFALFADLKPIVELGIGDRFIVINTLTKMVQYEDIVGSRNSNHIAGVAFPKRFFARKDGLFGGKKGSAYEAKEIQARIPVTEQRPAHCLCDTKEEQDRCQHACMYPPPED